MVYTNLLLHFLLQHTPITAPIIAPIIADIGLVIATESPIISLFDSDSPSLSSSAVMQ